MPKVQARSQEAARESPRKSNLWFTKPERVDRLRSVLGRGAVWVHDSVQGNEASDAFLFAGFEQRGQHLAHSEDATVTFGIEVDRQGNGFWKHLRSVSVPARSNTWLAFPANETGAWVRLRPNRGAANVTAVFQYRGTDRRDNRAAPIFDGSVYAAIGHGRLKPAFRLTGERHNENCWSLFETAGQPPATLLLLFRANALTYRL